MNLKIKNKKLEKIFENLVVHIYLYKIIDNKV